MKLKTNFSGLAIAMLFIVSSSTQVKAQNKGSKNAIEFFIGTREGSGVSFHKFLGEPELDSEGNAYLETPVEGTIKGNVFGADFEAVFEITAQGDKLTLNKNGLACNGDKSLNLNNPGPITIEFKEFSSGEEWVQYTGFRTITFLATTAVASAKVSNDPKKYKTPKLGEVTVPIKMSNSKKTLSITRTAKAFVVTQFSAKFLKRNKPKVIDSSTGTATKTKMASHNSTPLDIAVTSSGKTISWITKDESNVKDYEIVKRGTDQVLEVIQPLGADEYSLDFDQKVDLIVNKIKGKEVRITPTKK